MKTISVFVLFALISNVKCTICEFATPNKYIGNYMVTHGSTEVKPYFNMNIKTQDECKRKCRNDDKCFAISFMYNDLCSLFNTTDLHIHNDNSLINLFIWKECEWSSSFQPQDGRCKGMFIKYFDNAIKAKEDFMLLKVINTGVDICLNACSLHPLCKIINFKASFNRCTLHQSWHYSDKKQEAENGTDLYKWSCIPNFEKNIILPNEPKPNTLKCTGYWKITSQNSTIPNINSPGVYFFTQSYNACLFECTKNFRCNKALFNITESICILPFIENSDPNKFLQSLTYFEFEWICLKNDSGYPEMNKKEKEYIKMGLECVKLIDNNNVYISQDNCGHFPSKNSFVLCNQEKHTKQWTASDSCLVNQSFWKFKTHSRTLNLSGVYTNYTTRIFTGLTSFWMAHSKPNIYQNISFYECRRFDGSKSSKYISSSNITTRHHWYAYQSQGELPKYNDKPNYVVLSASQQPFYGCRTITACISLLRNLQIFYFNGAGATLKFSDIPYNFMLDESGNIYEARGWHNRCQAVKSFNSVSFCFGFIGRFVDIKPSLKFLQSVKELIEYAVVKEYLAKDYTLYIHQDATTHNISRNYAIIIKEWYRYRKYVPKDCSIVAMPVLLMSAIFIVIVAILLFIIYKSLKSTKNCKVCEFLHLIRFTQIFPEINDDEMTPFVEVDFNTVQCIVKEKEDSSDQKMLLKFCKVWFLNKSLQSLNSKYLDFELGNYLNRFQTYKKKIKIYEAISNSSRRPEDNVHIVLCFTNTHSRNLFVGLAENKLCICQHFNVNFVSFTDLSFSVI